MLLNHRIKALDGEIADRLADYGNPLEDLLGAGTNLTATIIAQAGDVRRFRDASAFARFCGAAPIPTGSGQPADGTACTAAATASSTPPYTASRSSSNATTPRPRPISLASSPKAKHPAKRAERSNATSQTSSTAGSSAGQKSRSNHKKLDIGESERFIRTLTAGSGTTTITANTQRLATNRPSLASTSEPTFLGLTPMQCPLLVFPASVPQRAPGYSSSPVGEPRVQVVIARGRP